MSTGGASVAQPSGTDPANQSVGQLLADISTDLSTLMRQELELAKAELKAEATKAADTAKVEGSKAGKAAAMFGAAGYIGHFAFLFLSLALWWLVRHILGDGNHWGWAFLIVAVLYGIIAAVLALSGKKKMKTSTSRSCPKSIRSPSRPSKRSRKSLAHSSPPTETPSRSHDDVEPRSDQAGHRAHPGVAERRRGCTQREGQPALRGGPSEDSDARPGEQPP
jgi:F0F1-type ATP synthase assembly protein I